MRFTRSTALFGTLFLVAMVSTASAGGLLISEVVDGSRTGGLPKYVELTNTGTSSIDLSQYSIGNMNNGSTTLGGGSSTQLPAVALAAGASFIVGYENAPVAPAISTFEDTYGFPPDMYIGPFTNGDDCYILFQGTATVPDGSDATMWDVYGQIGVDGTGTFWEYMDGWARRGIGSNQPDATFQDGTGSSWNFGGINTLDGVDDAAAKQALLDQTNPGTHDFGGFKGVVPGAPAWVLLVLSLGLAGAGAFAFRRFNAAQPVA